MLIKHKDGTTTPASFGQATEQSLSGQSAVADFRRAPLGRRPGLAPMDDVDGGAEPIVTPPTVESPGTDILSTAWALAEEAGIQCGNGAGVVALPPWLGTKPGYGGDYWYLYYAFDHGLDNDLNQCSYRLQVEQNLLCVADKLAAVADAVGTTVWPATYKQGSVDAYAAGTDPTDFGAEWDIPPQADADRFIVRDLAIHTLAMIPTLDAYAVPGLSAAIGIAQPGTCTQAFAWVANPANTPASTCPCASGGICSFVFGLETSTAPQGGYATPRFPPSATPLCDATHDYAPAIAQTALDINAQILRSGGRLLHDLVRRDVYSDMAAAAQQSAQSLDPIAGNQAAWGEGPAGRYGTIAHAARTLLGRLEVGDAQDFGSVADPACSGVTELNLLSGPTFGPDLSARVEDQSIRTPGQQSAVQLVERAGIVIPSCKIPADGSGLASALVDQLLLEEQNANHLASPPSSAALRAVVSPLQPSELVFAFERAVRTYRLIGNVADTIADVGDPGAAVLDCSGSGATNPLGDATGVNLLPGGLKLALNASGQPLIAASVSALNGIVISGGLSRSRLLTDPMARSGGMQEASECGESDGAWDEWGNDESAQIEFTAPTIPDAVLPHAVFQDPFHLGQAFARRLNLLQSDALSAGLDSSIDPVNTAKGGLAELRSWAGSTIIHAWANGSTDGSATNPSFVVRVSGMSFAKDFGVTVGADPTPVLQGAFGFVYGPPWVAECAAGLRDGCPAAITDEYLQTGTAAVVAPGSLSASGVVDDVFTLTVLLNGAKQRFTPPVGPTSGTPTGSHLYMVRLADPRSSAGQGRVIGALQLKGDSVGVTSNGRTTYTWKPQITSIVDAPMQRELVHDAIDLGAWVGAKPPALGDLSAAQTSGYCVDGVPRDLFVPLDNELVSGNNTYEDSWQAYLTLAQTAAQTADALGQQLIAEDLQISQNQQAAEEQLANICGDFGSLQTASVGNDGTITGAADDPTQSCLSEPLIDVVFLGKLPFSDPNNTQQIQNAIGCHPPAGTKVPPSAVALCAKSSLTAASLNIGVTDAGAPNGNGLSACDDIDTIIAPSIRDRLKGVQYANDLQDPSQSTAVMLNAVSQMQMVVDLQDNWHVTYGSSTNRIMDSKDANYWPACLNTGCTAASLPLVTQKMAGPWSSVFRNCSAGLVDHLGSCDQNSASELNMLKIRVTQALWMMAASAGVLPPGLVSQPIPAILTDDCAYRFGTYPTTACAAQDGTYLYPTGSANYYTGRTRSSSVCAVAGVSLGQTCLGLDPSDPNTSGGDVSAMGPLFPVPSSFGAFGNDVDACNDGSCGEVPRWYSLLYSNSYVTSINHMFAPNVAGIFDQCTSPLAPADQTKCKAGTAAAMPVPIAQLVARGIGLDGIACAINHGEPRIGSTPADINGPPWWRMVSAVKHGISAATLGLGGFGIGPQPARPFPTDLPSTESRTVWDQSAAYSTDIEPRPATDADLAALTPGSVVGWPAAFGNAMPATTWPPSTRALAFAGYGTGVSGTCGAATLLLQASTLACTPTPATVTVSSASIMSVPPVTKLSDIPVLEAWLARAATTMSVAAGQFYVQSIPKRVVDDFAAGTVGSGALGGTKGQAILAMEQQIQQLPSSWISMASDLTSISNAIQVANNAVVGAQLNEQTVDGQLALNSIQVQGAMTLALDNFLQTVAQAMGAAKDTWGGSMNVIPAAALTLADSVSMGNKELTQIQSLTNTAGETEQNQVDQALAQLATNTAPLWADVQRQMDALRGAVAQIDAAGQNVAQAENQAAYQAAVGTGSDFVSVSGQEVPIPVDTVLRRQSSATLQRYQAALTNAKALAYMARRAIEQRIGVPLDALTQQVGPVDAPASWADDICSLQGVNYASLSTASLASDGGSGIGQTADKQSINQFANAWVGDYVAKLQNFVTYYNVQYPSHQGEDTAVLSLRYDLLPPSGQCTTQAPNLLVNSGDLSSFSAAGWEPTPCDGTLGKCLVVVGGYSLPDPQDGPWGSQGEPGAASTGESGATWLLDAAYSSASSGGSGSDGGAPVSSATSDDRVGQTLQLAAGSYVLSWWDQARDANGNVVSAPGVTLSGAATSPAGYTPVSYIAEVLDGAGSRLTVVSEPPYMPPQAGADAGQPSLWSERRTLSFTVASSGTYTIAFAASAASDAPGSVAIADVQLELAANGQPSTYVATAATNLVQGLNCPLSDADLRSAFTHSCDAPGACHYDLALPLIVDTSTLDGSPVGSKLASGNYNYRQNTMAINIVGTGVHSCTNDPTPNCYGSAYLQYDLKHDGTSAGIVGYDGNARIFDFGVAGINHGKALAAERYITVPLSSSDQSLISQPGIEHVEFGGRPLDGSYHLRIWDSPDLNWSALQDIQLIVDYEYWSQIQVNGNTSDMRHPQRLKRAPLPFIPAAARRHR